MKTITFLSLLAVSILLSPVPAMALPDDAADLHQLIMDKYEGDANAYVADKDGDFRRMGCRDRADLVQQLLDDGLKIPKIRPFHLERFYDCALKRKSENAFQLIVEPTSLKVLEERENTVMGTIQAAVFRNNYDMTLVLLENGSSKYIIRDWAKNLTGDGHLLMVVDRALMENKTEAIRAFRDAGHGDIIADANQRDFFEAFDTLARHGINGSADGGGLLGDIAGIAVGSALGGSPTELLISSAGLAILDDGGDEGSARSQINDLEKQRKFARYLTTVEMPPENAPLTVDGPEGLLPPMSTQKDVLGELERLGDLRDRGVITKAQFEALRRDIIESVDD